MLEIVYADSKLDEWFCRNRTDDRVVLVRWKELVRMQTLCSHPSSTDPICVFGQLVSRRVRQQKMNLTEIYLPACFRQQSARYSKRSPLRVLIWTEFPPMLIDFEAILLSPMIDSEIETLTDTGDLVRLPRYCNNPNGSIRISSLLDGPFREYTLARCRRLLILLPRLPNLETRVRIPSPSPTPLATIQRYSPQIRRIRKHRQIRRRAP